MKRLFGVVFGLLSIAPALVACSKTPAPATDQAQQEQGTTTPASDASSVATTEATPAATDEATPAEATDQAAPADQQGSGDQ